MRRPTAPSIRRPVAMRLLLLCLSVAAACRYSGPPCTRIYGFASYIDAATGCCELCKPGNRCNSTTSVPCDVATGGYQPLHGMAVCHVALPCSQFVRVPGTPTSARVCGNWSTCDPLVQYQVAAPTLTTDRVCACTPTRVGDACHPCNSFVPFCNECQMGNVPSEGPPTTPLCQQARQPVCLSCWSGYAVATNSSGQICVPCTWPKCTACDSLAACVACESGYVPDSIRGGCRCATNYCAECTSTNCTACHAPRVLDDHGECSECTSPAFYANGTCMQPTTHAESTTTMRTSSLPDTPPTIAPATQSSDQTSAPTDAPVSDPSSNAESSASKDKYSRIAIPVMAVFGIILLVLGFAVLRRRRVAAGQNHAKAVYRRPRAELPAVNGIYETPSFCTQSTTPAFADALAEPPYMTTVSMPASSEVPLYDTATQSDADISEGLYDIGTMPTDEDNTTQPDGYMHVE